MFPNLLATNYGVLLECLIIIRCFSFVIPAQAGIYLCQKGKIMKKKEKDKLFDNLPTCAAEFIKLVIKKMRYRKKVRADVMAELTAHFEDGLKDCKTDEEKEQRAKELIADFGDAKLLGILLRRAKKRCRPLWRTVVARTFQTVGILILCFILYVGWFLTGRPVITTDYLAQLNQMVRPAADESLNAAPLYEQAVKRYEKSSNEISELLGTKYNEATPEQKKLIAKWLDDNEEIFDLVITGTQKPYYWRRYETGQNTSRMMAVLVPNLSEFRSLVRLFAWRARLRAEQARYEDAFSDMKSCYRLGQHIKGDNTFLIEQLVGIAIEALATQTLRDILSRYEIDSIALTALQKDLEQIITGEDFAISFKAEKLSMYDEIQRSFTDGPGGGHIIPSHIAVLLSEVQIVAGLSASIGGGPLRERPKPGWLSKRISDIKDVVDDVIDGTMGIFNWAKKGGHILFFHPNKQQTFKMTQEFYDYWDKLKLKSPAQLNAEDTNFEEQSLEIIKGNILLEFLTPALSRMNETSWLSRTNVQSLIAILSLLRYRLDKGAYPDDLNELVTAGYLKELPMDLYSDKPLVYKKTDDSFTLYSAGRNFKDDGGEVFREHGRIYRWGTQEAGDAVFWPVPKPQTRQEQETKRPKWKLRGKTHRKTKAEQK